MICFVICVVLRTRDMEKVRTLNAKTKVHMSALESFFLGLTEVESGVRDISFEGQLPDPSLQVASSSFGLIFLLPMYASR